MRPAVKLFAAVDENNEVRFISDVPAGAACGCFCVACRSPLVARKGNIKAHHFAHEASQERPECLVGALNLLRRFSIEFLRSQGTPVLPPYRVEVSRRLLSGIAVEVPEWSAQPISVEWLTTAAQGDAVARMVLDNDVAADLLVTIAEDPPRPSRTPLSQAAISFFTWLPEYEALCSHAAVIEHLRSTGRFIWIYQPDAYGLVADAINRLRQRFEAEERDAEARARREQERFDKAYSSRTPAASGPATPIQPDGPAWAVMKKKNASYFGYRLADGTVWVYFEIETGGIALRPLNLQDWEAGIPGTLGRYDANNDVVLCSAPPTFRSVVATRISSQFSDIEGLVDPNGDQVGFFGGRGR
jgi:hypothetical protein